MALHKQVDVADEDGELGIAAAFGDSLTCLFDVSEFKIESFPGPTQSLTRFFHAMILSRDVDSGRGRQRETFLVDYIHNPVPNSIEFSDSVLKSEQNEDFGVEVL